MSISLVPLPPLGTIVGDGEGLIGCSVVGNTIASSNP